MEPRSKDQCSFHNRFSPLEVVSSQIFVIKVASLRFLFSAKLHMRIRYNGRYIRIHLYFFLSVLISAQYAVRQEQNGKMAKIQEY